MYWQIVLLLHFYSGSAVKHGLRYFITLSSGVTEFPELVALMVLDNFQGGWCDGKVVQAKNEWGKKILENPTELEYHMSSCVFVTHTYRAYLEDLKQQFNQSEGIHIFQRIHGCDWDDETGEMTGFNQFGYDGEDFISLDPVAMTWVAAKPQALITKHKWDSDTVHLQGRKIFNTHICPEKLKMYLQYLHRFFPQKKAQPSVFLLQKTPSSPVSCHVTGFHPENGVVFWRKDGQKLQEEVEYTEILPNHDGTFQTRADLRLSPVSPEEWSRYECVFHRPGDQEDITLKLDKDVIRTNWVPPPQFPVGVVSGVTVLLLLLLLVFILAFFIWKRHNNGFKRANSSDPASQLTTAPLSSTSGQE